MRFPSFVRAAVCALALVFSAGTLVHSTGAHAQMGGGSYNASPSDKDKDRNKKDRKESSDRKGEAKYPNATRKEPELKMSSGDQKDLNKAADLINDGKDDEAEPIVQKVIANDRASPYAQAFAHTLQAQVFYEKDKSAEAIAEYRKAIDMNALPNDAHFQTLYQIAQLQVQDEKYADALTTLDQWEKGTGSTTADELALKANAYYRTDKFQDAVDTMKKAVDSFKRDLQKIRTGRANASMLDGIKVDYYGTPTPLNQVATVQVVDARLITVKPWEKNMIAVIDKTIRASDLGINPVADSELVRLPIPPLTQERRKELAKVVGKQTEEARVAVRSARRDAMDMIKDAEKDKQITEDERKKGEAKVQELTDKYIGQLEDVAKAKEKEIMEL